VTTLVPLIPNSPGNAYRGIGEVVMRNLEVFVPVLKKLEPMDRLLIIQYVQEANQYMWEEEEDE
jgi:hypothetical protein